MQVVTFDDLRRRMRCPYAYALDRTSGRTPLTATECMDMSVHDALRYADQKRAMGGKPDRDDVMSMFWDSWDRHLPDVDPAPDDALALIRFGERCIDNYLRGCTRRPTSGIVAAGVAGIVELPGGREMLASIDVVYGGGSTATICKYVCDPVLRSREELARDPEMRVCALWVLRNMPGYDRVRVRWEFLASGTSEENSILPRDLEAVLSEAADAVEPLGASAGDALPRETAHCGECIHRPACPRFLHQDSLGDVDTSEDEGVRLVDEYAELQEKIDALKRRQALLEAKRDEIGERLFAYADAAGYMAVSGRTAKALVRHEKKVELPQDKSAIIERLRSTGQYDSLSMVNYPRLRSDIAKGIADPEVARMAEVVDVRKIYLRTRSDGR